MKPILSHMSICALLYSASVVAEVELTPLGEDTRFYIRLGSYLVGYNETKINISSPYLLGINLDLDDDLGMNTNNQVGRIDGYYRIKGKHSIGFSYYELKHSGTTNAGRVIELPDPDDPTGSITIPIGAKVDSFLNTQILRVNYIYNFFISERAGMGLNLGLHTAKIETGIKGELVVGDPASVNGTSVSVTAPLPVLGLKFSYRPLSKLRLMYENNIFFLSYSNYEGLYTDQSLLAEYRFWKWGGIGGGLNINTLKLNAKDNDAARQLDLTHGIGAAQLYLFFVY
jgi:hypothetical protein